MYEDDMAALVRLPYSPGTRIDRDVVLRALVASVKEFRQRGRAPDLIFGTGDVAYRGKDDRIPNGHGIPRHVH